MKKRVTALVLAFVMVLGTVAVAAGTEKSITVTPMSLSINGQVVTPTKSNGDAAEVFAYDGATYVPLRYLSELLGISVEWDKNDPNTAKLIGNITLPTAGGDGTYTGTATGFGGVVTATVTVVGGKITACTLEGAEETPAIGGAALETLQAQIIAAGSADIDGVSGATYTSNGVKEAVKAALNTAKGAVAAGSMTYTPGTYDGEAYGNVSMIRVKVTTSADAITGIELVSQGETPIIFDTAWDNVTGDIMKYQSLDVDTVSGATTSSRGILSAVENAVSLAASDLTALKAPRTRETVPPTQITKSADVVVVGGGGAGLASAVTAVQEGANVIVLEKAPYLGGNLLVFGGIYNTPDEALQSSVEMSAAVKASIEAAISEEPVNEEHRKAMADVKADYEAWQKAGSKGLFDSPAWFSLQTWNSGDKVANKSLVDIMCSNALDGYNWVKSLGVEFDESKITQGAGSLYQRTHGCFVDNGSSFINAYTSTLAKNPDKCEILMNTQATELIMEGDKVVGVSATDTNGNTYTIKANNGVILATGGFAGNVELRQKYCEGATWEDLGPGVGTTNLKAVTGDGILMAEKIGASFVDMDQLQLLHLGNPFTGSTKGIVPYKGRSSNDVIFVNAEGDRFVAEDQRRDVMCNAIIKQPGSFYWMIHDSQGIDPYSADTEGKILGGYMYRADTLEELAALIDVPADRLKNAVDSYNADYDKAQEGGAYADELGRTLFTLRLEEGPWFAGKRVASAHHTMGGVEITADAKVVSAKGGIIPGLYAAGEVCGGIHGGNRVGGNASVDTVVFGRIAGANAANNK